MNSTAYTERATNWSSVIISGLLLVPLIAISVSTGLGRSTGVVVIAVALLGLLGEVVTASNVRASCGSKGVIIRWGPWGGLERSTCSPTSRKPQSLMFLGGQ